MNDTAEQRPEHHIHTDSERLPAARGADPTVNCGPLSTDRTPNSEHDHPNQTSEFGSTAHYDMERTHNSSDRAAFNAVLPGSNGWSSLGFNMLP